MNRAKGGGWEFLEVTGRPGYTWSCGSGCTGHGCACYLKGVCWAQRIVKRLGHICPLCPNFKPHVHDGTQGTPNRLSEPRYLKKPAVITPMSTGDLFCLPYNDVLKILDIIRVASWHIFAIFTKMPRVARQFNPYPENVWFMITVNGQGDVWRLDRLEKIKAPIRGAIFEPLYGPVRYDLSWLDWIIIGPQTKPILQPDKAWVQGIIDNAPGVPVFMKSTLAGDPKMRRGPQILEAWYE